VITVCVFCGAAAGASPVFCQVADELGSALSALPARVVYGAGGVGVMGALSDAVLRNQGDIVGVIPESLMAREFGRTDLPDLRVVASMHERKQLMHDLSDAFIVLPGGLGTLEELFETITWTQLGLHRKPIVLLNAERYFDPLVELLWHGVEHGFISPYDLAPIKIVDDVQEALKRALPR
jgi:uncharacterized protein (TIGR00730 family)